MATAPHAASTASRGGHGAGLARAAAHFVEGWREVPRARSLTTDLLAGLTVAAVALPLNVGLAIASGMPPSAGIVAGAVGGVVAATFGSSKLQVSGPAAALSVMVLALARDFGVTGVAAATVFVGVVELALAFALAGRVIKYVPESVLAGFTTGVGLKLLDQQLPELLGFPEVVDWASKSTPSTIDLVTMMHHPKWLHDVSWLAAVSGVFVAFTVTSFQSFKRFPAAIVSIALITFVSVYLGWDIERVASVGAVPDRLPLPALPLVPDEQWIDLFVRATPLAVLAAAESLLSASAVDRMAGLKKPHDSNVELFGQALANIVTGFFAGMPVTGVIARSGVNVQSGAKTRLAAIFHALMLAGAVMFLSGHISRVPLAALAGLLCVIGFRLVEIRTLAHLVRDHRLEALAFVVAAVGTVSGHLMTGLVGGLLVHFGSRWLKRHDRAALAEVASNRSLGIRAVLQRDRAEARRPAHHQAMPAEARKWLGQIRERPLVAASAFIHPAATVIGRVVLGEQVHIAADTSVRADEGAPFHIGSHTNIQDGVILHALKDKRVMVAGEGWAIYVGKNVSLAHGALVHGPCYIGDETFVGFKAVVHDSVVGARCYIGIGATVVGVEIPDGRFVPHGRVVDSADAVDALPLVSEAHMEFNEDVVEVNRGLAVAYHRHAREGREGMALVRHRLDPDVAEAPVWDVRWPVSSGKERF
ncbi:MAG: Sulfate permease [Labilithrix sp.]|nr:Sulfate permease [Labilithrix sp.]